MARGPALFAPGPQQPMDHHAFPPQQQQQPFTPPRTTNGGPHFPGFTPGDTRQPMPPQIGVGSGAHAGPGQNPAARILSPEMTQQSQCPAAYGRLSFEKFPDSEATRSRAGNMPLGIIYQPFNEAGPAVPTVNFGNMGVVRCRRCRSYVCPFALWMDGGRRWQCIFCWNTNDTESEYFCQLDPNTGTRLDRAERVELHSGVFDIIAPDEYVLRPPPPPSYLFVIDVSVEAVQSGLLQVVAAAIKRVLGRLPGAPRTRVGFITYDRDVHFYDLTGGPNGKGGPRMLVVSDLNKMFRPFIGDLLVDVADRRTAIEAFLDSFHLLHASAFHDEAALGPALEAAFDIMGPVGGRISVFQAMLPMVVPPVPGTDGAQEMSHGGLAKPGRGADGKALGGPREHDFMLPGSQWYTGRGDAFSKQHICVDLFVCAPRYVDAATSGELAHLTAGRIRFYPRFHAQRDGERLVRDVERSLLSCAAMEAVMRVRATAGVKVTRFYGSFSMRSRDLLALPEVDMDGNYAFEFSYDEDAITGTMLAVQSAVLYTTMQGERRIRVTNHCIPITTSPVEALAAADPDIVAALWIKNACEDVRTMGFDQARDQLKSRFLRMSESIGQSPRLMEQLPLTIVGALKSVALRGGTDVHFDERYFMLRLMGVASVPRIMAICRPKVWVLSVSGPPAEVAPTRASLNSGAVFLLDNGVQLIVWIGSRAPPQLLQALFGIDDASRVDPGQLRVVPPAPTGESPVKLALWDLVVKARRSRPEDFAPVIVAREGDNAVEARFFWGLVLDPATFRGGEVTVDDLMKRARVAPAGAGGGMGAPRQLAGGPPGPGPAMAPMATGPPPPRGGQSMPPHMQQPPPMQQPPAGGAPPVQHMAPLGGGGGGPRMPAYGAPPHAGTPPALTQQMPRGPPQPMARGPPPPLQYAPRG